MNYYFYNCKTIHVNTGIALNLILKILVSLLKVKELMYGLLYRVTSLQSYKNIIHRVHITYTHRFSLVKLHDFPPKSTKVFKSFKVYSM